MPTPWKITEQWKDNEEEELVDWTQITFTKALNNTGSFSIQFDDTERAVDIMESAWLRIYYDGHCHFHGKIHRKNFGGAKIIIKGTDWYGLLNNIEVKYCAADWDNKDVTINNFDYYPRWDGSGNYHKKEVSEYIKRLLDIYTGETSSDKDVDYSNLDATGWSDSFNHPRTNLGTLMGNLFNSAKVSGSRYGYGTWFEYQDPDLPYLWAKPFGSGRYPRKLYFQGQPSMTWEEGDIANDITIQGSFAFPEPKSPDVYTEGDAGNWTSRACTVLNESTNVTTGLQATKINVVSTSDFDFQRALDGSSLVDSAGTIYFSHISFDFLYDLDSVSLTTMYVRLYDTIPTKYIDLSDIQDLLIDPATYYRRITTCVYTANGSPQNLNYIKFYFDFVDAPSGDLFIDNLRVYFKPVKEQSKNEASIQKHGYHPRVFQGNAIRQYTYAKELADSFVQLMKDPTLQVRGTLNYFPPDLHLNDAVEIPIYGVTWPLYVSRLSISATPTIIRTMLNAGSIRPTIVQILKGLNMKEKSLESAADVSGGFDTSLFQSDLCFELKETHCPYACMHAACQNPWQVHSMCTGVTDRDPCLNTCQRYSQLKQRCATCQTISYGGDIV